MFVVCGFGVNNLYESSIEGLDLLLGVSWYILAKDDHLLSFTGVAISAISATKFVIYGGGITYFNRHEINLVVDLKTQKMHKIHRQEMNFRFASFSNSVWIGRQRHVTLGGDNRLQLHIVQM